MHESPWEGEIEEISQGAAGDGSRASGWGDKGRMREYRERLMELVGYGGKGGSAVVTSGFKESDLNQDS